MRKIHEVLRLRHECGLSNRKIAVSCELARSTVADYLNRASAAGLSCPRRHSALGLVTPAEYETRKMAA